MYFRDLLPVVPERRHALHRPVRPTTLTIVVDGQDGPTSGYLTDPALIEAGDRRSILRGFRADRRRRVEFD
jgi:hypothetical protein